MATRRTRKVSPRRVEDRLGRSFEIRPATTVITYDVARDHHTGGRTEIVADPRSDSGEWVVLAQGIEIGGLIHWSDRKWTFQPRAEHGNTAPTVKGGIVLSSSVLAGTSIIDVLTSIR